MKSIVFPRSGGLIENSLKLFKDQLAKIRVRTLSSQPVQVSHAIDWILYPVKSNSVVSEFLPVVLGATVTAEFKLRSLDTRNAPNAGSNTLISAQLCSKESAMYPASSLLAFSLLAIAYGQQVGTQQAENHPQLTTQQCTAGGSCQTLSTSVVLDANWRWLHTTSGYTNCYTGNTWDATLCPDPVTCAQNCALDGADYAGTYGITSSGSALTLKFVTGANVGSRVYLMASDSSYQMLKLKNQEFTFDVDMSNLPCGLNGALYLTEMDADGGTSKYPNNKAGAKYGTGYCDSQCPHDIKFINGEANILGWEGSSNDPNSGTGQYGTCCNEMDIWEANSMAAAYTPHVCTVQGQTRCSGTDCGDGDQRYDGVCDKDGCDFNSWRMGNQTFLGPGLLVDTKSKFTVVTQFVTSDNTTSGTLSEIRRLYVQNGKVIQNSAVNIPGIPAGNSVTDAFCNAQKTAFGDTNSFESRGGLKAMDTALQQGMVLALSVWDDYAADMLWLDSDYPTNKSASTPGVSRGPCATISGVPADVESQSPGASVIFSNIKFGDIGSTFSATGGGGGSGTTTSPSGSPTGGGTVAQWGQCGGTGWTGATQCVSPYTCHVLNPYYSQCY
ncbi:Exoglucanase 1 [Grifola frondosa]|uniref:Glucanase n=1 Tax=Grifola frondosa TaxID=5627 RepID=A0A1C7MA27_GRIFR|nr:Exoglucanase 1 [Grifola frondosa]